MTTQIPIIASYFSLENYAEPRSPSRMHSVWTWYDMNTTKKRRTVRFLPCGVPRDQIAKLGIPQKKDNYSSNKQDNSDEWRRIRAISIGCSTIHTVLVTYDPPAWNSKPYQENSPRRGLSPMWQKTDFAHCLYSWFILLILDTYCHFINKIKTWDSFYCWSWSSVTNFPENV